MLKKTPKPPKILESISVVEFANRFAHSARQQQQRFTWFLGAGCSISSGIPSAGTLVQRWLEELHRMQQARNGLDHWTKTLFSDYDPTNPARHYAQAFAKRHPAPIERQREIELICADGDPKYGYATFAQILSLPDVGPLCNTVLTTNFDDLIADALYVYGERHARPQIITHEALARYVRIASPRPTIVKLHGDAHLDPKNLSPETKRINNNVAKQLYPFIQDSALVFVGYGGNDESILHFFRGCPNAALASQIYWVGKHDPAPFFRDFLIERKALRVDHADFDRLMHHLRGALKLDHPDSARWTNKSKDYLADYERFEKELNASPDSDEKVALRRASDEAELSLPDEWKLYLRSLRAATSDKKDEAFREGLVKFPHSALINGMYALFLEEECKDLDTAETYYKRAIDADPKHAGNLGNYALFLEEKRKNPDAAETYYKRAIDADPKHAINLGNYAVFLKKERNDLDAAETYYKRAIDADPKHATNLGNYALFLTKERNDLDAAETYYKRAIESDPKQATNLCHYAVFLTNDRRDLDAAETYYKRAIDADPKHATNLGNYAVFLRKERNDLDAAETFYNRAIDADPKHAVNLGHYAAFLTKDRKDLDAAKTYYKRAIDADPKNANSLGNYAQILIASGRISEGIALVDRALELENEPALNVELQFYRFAHDKKRSMESLQELKKLLMNGARSSGWDLSPNIERAGKQGFAEIDLLRDLAAVISADRPIDILDSYTAWREA